MFVEDKATQLRTAELEEIHQPQSPASNMEIEGTWLATASSRETVEGASQTSGHEVLPHASKCLHNTTTHNIPAMTHNRLNVVRLAYTTGKVKGQVMQILLDLGASCSAISKQHVKIDQLLLGQCT